MTPEVKALVNAAKTLCDMADDTCAVFPLLTAQAEMTRRTRQAIDAVKALDNPQAAHNAALQRGAEWDNDFGQQDIKMGR